MLAWCLHPQLLVVQTSPVYTKYAHCAPVAQWIERRPPEPKAQVRVLSGVLFVYLEAVVLSSIRPHHAPRRRRSKPYDPLKPVGGLRHRPRGWFNRFMHNPWVLAAAMGVIAFGTILGLYLQQTGAGNRSTASSSPVSQAVDQTLVTPTATATATATAGPQRVFSAAPPMAIDTSKQYTATVKTAKGDIVLSLYAKDAPQTVNSFVFLAQHGFFNGLTFDRVVKDFVIQGGDPKGDGTGNPGYSVPDEINAHKNDAGAVAMANGGPNTDGSQFYIDLSPQPNLDGKYTVFGHVVSGMDVVQSIGQTPHNPGDFTPAVTIDSVDVSSS